MDIVDLGIQIENICTFASLFPNAKYSKLQYF